MNKCFQIVFRVSLLILVVDHVSISLEQLWRKKFKMFGELQGVGFRNFSKRVANELGLHGYARHKGYMITGVVEGTKKQIDKWADKMLEGYNLTGKESGVFSISIQFFEIDAVTKYKYRNFSIRQNKPLFDDRIMKSESLGKDYSFTGEEIEL